ncbi:uncharacterized protein LOC113987110 isoform X2 [Pipra filicauda]|uniref:Uncharacterized protein LOC113987110 isoform X2 n=1 Tax=Pipra filicauda TaxID=649802 RepID=A0A7R5KH96_9PASS|nr:uncharacterized protein LOC113987110 isoform X2 [Pipra filicauda]
METSSDLGGQLRREWKSEPRWCSSTSLYLASQLLLPCSGLRLLRAEREPLPSARGLPLAGLRARRSSTRRLPPAALPRSAPCPAPLPVLAPRRSLSAAGHSHTSGGPGRCRPCPGRPSPHPPAAPPERPGEAPALSFSRRALSWPCQDASRAGLASPDVLCWGWAWGSCRGSTWCSVCVCLCVCVSSRVTRTPRWGREPVSAPLEASGQSAARCGRAVEAGGAVGAARAAGRAGMVQRSVPCLGTVLSLCHRSAPVASCSSENLQPMCPNRKTRHNS